MAGTINVYRQNSSAPATAAGIAAGNELGIPAGEMMIMQNQVWDLGSTMALVLDEGDIYSALAGGMELFRAPDDSISEVDAPYGFVVPTTGLYSVSVSSFLVVETDDNNAAGESDEEIVPRLYVTAPGIQSNGVIHPTANANRVFEVPSVVSVCFYMEAGWACQIRMDPMQFRSPSSLVVNCHSGHGISFPGSGAPYAKFSLHWVREFDITGTGGGGGDGGESM